VKKQSLLRRQPHRPQRRPLFREPEHVPLERSEGRVREDHLVAFDGLEIVNPNSGGMTRPLRTRLQRQDPSSIAGASREMPFERVEDTGRNLRTEIARWRRDLDVQKIALP
jgi:hypothetical protein